MMQRSMTGLRGSRVINGDQNGKGGKVELNAAKRAKEAAKAKAGTNLPTGTTEKPSTPAPPAAGPVFGSPGSPLPFGIDPVMAGVAAMLVVVVVIVAVKS